MATTSNLAALAATLQQKKEQDRQQVEALTQSELDKLAANLKQLSTDVLNSTRSATEQQQQALQQHSQNLAQMLEAALEQQQAQAEKLAQMLAGPESSAQAVMDQASKIRAQANKDAQAIKNEASREAVKQKALAKMILAVAGASCLVLCLLIWGWSVWQSPWTTEQMSNGPHRVLKGEGWTTCTMSNGAKLPCQKIDN